MEVSFLIEGFMFFALIREPKDTIALGRGIAKTSHKMVIDEAHGLHIRINDC